MDRVQRIPDISDLTTDQDDYAVFYPDDGTLVAGYSLDMAQSMRDNLASLYPDAYVVRVRIERV